MVVVVLVSASQQIGTGIPPASAQSEPGTRATTPVVVRDGVWYLRHSNTPGPADLTFSYGRPGDFPVMGDWDGDGTDTPGVVRGPTWFLKNANTGGVADIVFDYGSPADTPVVGDWDGDGTDTPGVVSGANWLLRNANSGGGVDILFGYGSPADTPVVGDWDGDGTDTPGVVSGANWLLRNANSAGGVDILFGYGRPGDRIPNHGRAPPLRLERGDEGPAVVRLQDRLEQLGYWVGPKDGIFGDLTEQAVYALQKYEGLPVDGVVDADTHLRLDRAAPARATTTTGDIVEIDKTRQLAFVVRGGETIWTFNASTGDEEPYTYGGQQYDAVTPTGRFEIFRQIDGWRTSHLGELYRPKYFTTTGIALHGSPSVPPYAVSHGCVRVSIAAMDHIWVHDLAPIGIEVWVYGSLTS